MEIFSKVGGIAADSLTIAVVLFVILISVVIVFGILSGVRELILLRKGYTVTLITILGIVLGVIREDLSFDVVLGGAIIGFIGGLTLVALAEGSKKKSEFED